MEMEGCLVKMNGFGFWASGELLAIEKMNINGTTNQFVCPRGSEMKIEDGSDK